jgi:hypothetical protein
VSVINLGTLLNGGINCPTLRELAGKPLVILLPNGKRCSLGEYCKSWRTLKTLPPDTEVKGWTWFPVKARMILTAIRRGVQERINMRGGLTNETPQYGKSIWAERRIRRQLEKRVRHDCKWCGQPLGRYAPEHDRFCDAGCRQSYNF